MASQVITVVKVAGAAGDWVWARLGEWAATRRAADPRVWQAEDWPTEVRQEVEQLVDRLRAHRAEPPVVHFVEWADLWSMGDTLARWLTPSSGAEPLRVWGDRYELYAYLLPDDGALARHLDGAGPQQHPEYDWLVQRLREAVRSWGGLYDRAVLLAVRSILGASVTDEELTDSLRTVPTWLCGPG